MSSTGRAIPPIHVRSYCRSREDGREVARRAIGVVQGLLEQLLEPLGGLGGERTKAFSREWRPCSTYRSIRRATRRAMHLSTHISIILKE